MWKYNTLEGDKGGVILENNNNRQDPKKSQNKRSIIICLIAALGVFLVFSFMNSQVEKASNKEITYDEFIKMLEDGIVKEVVLSSDKIEIIPVSQNSGLYEITYYTGVI